MVSMLAVKLMHHLSAIVLLGVLYSHHVVVNGCLIAGSDTGECTDPKDFDLLIPFCKQVVQYTACLPRYQSVWFTHSALTKDKFIEDMYYKLNIQRQMFETNQTMQDKNIDEWNQPHDVVPRFTENPDCQNAFRNFFCWMNFPRCDAEGRSLLMCRSVCENFFTACKYHKDLWRCGDPKYSDGYEAEITYTFVNKVPVYYRAPFPGSPFKDNAFDPDTNKPLIVCTPSLENTAAKGCTLGWTLTGFWMVFCLLIVW
ncbi:TPA: hypothetical protein N0F65_007156 [Lagenidium giganteum]|uniref:FZ domain-containing protein n=1 Tax=Lagenidium giganteum TaxID=4803 RepID=A0AAV2YY43_9STRA|nr:TPA: hypothetical protein N0F65_007156 [Lagenidium giganteum]